MKGTKNFERLIKAYLDRFAEKDKIFADKYQNSKNKSIEDCCNFIASQVQKMNVVGLSDMEVYSLAVHYYEEENIDFNKVSFSVVSNQELELTEEEKEEERAKARQKFQDKCYNDYLALQKKKSNTAQNNNVQMSLFD